MSKDKSTEFSFSKENTIKQKKVKKTSFGKVVFLPFIVSIIGTSIVLFLAGFLVNRYTFFNNLANLIYRRQDIKITKPIDQLSSASTMFNLEDFNNISTNVAEKNLASVVGIKTEFKVNNLFGGHTIETAMGSGFIISEEGHIITNYHVINPQSTSSFFNVSKADKVTVSLHNNDTIEATIVGSDELTDIAVLKIEYKNLKPVEFADSSQIKIGEFVMTIGRPYDLDNSVTVGVISGFNREIKKSNSTFNAIQTDAAINIGNSGGPLINADGKVIGITTLKISGSDVDSLGFAIPINQAKNIATQLIEKKTIERPELGIIGTDISEAFQHLAEQGILVQEVKKGSPAEKAGILVQDIITKINDKEIKSFTDIDLIKDEIDKGETMNIELIRSGKKEKLS